MIWQHTVVTFLLFLFAVLVTFPCPELASAVAGPFCLETGSQDPVATRGPDLTVRIGVKDRISKLLSSQYVLGFWGPFKP